MIPEPSRNAIRNAALLLAWVPIVMGIPFLAVEAYGILPTFLSNFLFFWSQSAFPYNTFTAPPPHVGARVWPGLWLLFWIILGVAFVWRVRALRPRTVFLLAGALALAGTIALQLGIAAAGLYFELDGP